MKKIFDTTGKEVTEGNTIMLYNVDSEKWSLELVVKDNDTLYAQFETYLRINKTKLIDVKSTHIVRMYDECKRDFFHNDNLKIDELFPIDYNKIHSLMFDARNKFKGDDCWDMTAQDYLDFFKPYEGQYDKYILENAIKETVKTKVK